MSNDSVYWEPVCGELPFWDYATFWNTTTPDFTECFHHTILIWVPCAFLWLFTPLKLWFSVKSPYRSIPWTLLNISKLVFCIVLCILDVVHLSTPGTMAIDDYAAIVRLCTVDLALVLIWLDKYFGIVSSAVISVFWIVFCLANAFTFRSSIVFIQDDETFFILNMIRFPIVFAQMILSLMADARPTYAIAPYKVELMTKSDRSSFITNIFFIWYDKLALIGYRRTMKMQELGELPQPMATNTTAKRFDRSLDIVIKKSKRSFKRRKSITSSTPLLTSTSVTNIPKDKKYLFKGLVSEFGPGFGMVMFLKFTSDCVSYLNPLVLDMLIKFTASNEPTWHGVLYTCLLGLVTYVEAILVAHTVLLSYTIGIKVRSSLMSYVFRKALRLSPNSKSETTVGQIVNLMAVDVMKISFCVEVLANAFALPIQVSFALFELWLYVGPTAMVCLGFIVVFQAISIYIARRAQRIQFLFMRLKDKRIKLMNQVLNGIKVLKLYAWEEPFLNYVTDFRLKELKQLKIVGYLNSFNTVLWGSSSVTISLAMFAVYVMISAENVLDASTAFVTLTIFNIVRRPLFILPSIIASMIEATVSFSRLNEYSWKDELKPGDVMIDPNHKFAVEIRDGSFSWTTANNLCLKNINLKVSEGQLLIIVGSVGCGKSSLISAVLGEMIKVNGNVIRKHESIGYASQIPWIQNATLKDNILFGKQFNQNRYEKVLEACAMLPDLEILPAGDMTEIGEKGINLSGGQKQRVSLARAVYTNADLYLMDDTLSAVDNHVGKHIFEEVIGPHGILKQKTRILVTNKLVYAPYADQVVVLSDGTIAEIGTYDELIKDEGILADLVETFVTTGNGKENGDQIVVDDKPSPDADKKPTDTGSKAVNGALGDKSKGALVQSEGMAVGKISYKIYWEYFKSFGYHGIFLFLGLTISYGFFAGSTVWLSIWSNDKPTEDGKQNLELRNYRLSVYGGLSVGFVVFMGVWMISMLLGSLRASSKFHINMLKSVFRAPQWFFDTTPTGRILNRFSSDIDTIDMPLPGMIRPLLNFIAQTITSLIIITIQMPWFALAALPILICFYLIQRFYIGGGRQLRRYESTSKSPIYSMFSETVAGISTIRAFSTEQMFYHQLTRLLDTNALCGYLTTIAQLWLALRMELFGAILLIMAGLFAVFQKESFTPSVVALVISYTITAISNFKILFRSVSVVETNMVSVERILSYTASEVPHEAPWVTDKRPPATWPHRGAISFTNYKTKYREELENVLRGVTLKINPGEKVGIAGRTGAGKSSMTLALFRIVEPTDGGIVIDDVDIMDIGLHDLRSRMTIIPQDPVLFAGPLRFNLDPFNANTDEEIWTALDMAHLKPFITTLPDGLKHEISEGGENLSVGQRQLVCLARALLRKSQILILDEATAAVDLETDSLIQKIVRQIFANCTVVTIAHRLNTIVDYDKIVVMEKGVIKECDSVTALLQNPNSEFYKLAKEEGLV
ncbi:Multidrug resistance-associated protein 1 [Chamberlinius hualienensis]